MRVLNFKISNRRIEQDMIFLISPMIRNRDFPDIWVLIYFLLDDQWIDFHNKRITSSQSAYCKISERDSTFRVI